MVEFIEVFIIPSRHDMTTSIRRHIETINKINWIVHASQAVLIIMLYEDLCKAKANEYISSFWFFCCK